MRRTDGFISRRIHVRGPEGPIIGPGSIRSSQTQPPMNRRKLAHANAFAQIKRLRRVSRKNRTLGVILPSLYNRQGMPETNLIIQGDCIQKLNDGPEGWVDLVFADPPFTIGYLYDGYNDERKCEDYLKFSEEWMRAVHRPL